MRRVFILILVCVYCANAGADTLRVNYASFYSHVKKLDSPDTDLLRFAFGFQHIAEQRLCVIADANIVTQKQTLALTVEGSNRFTVPVDKILKMAKAQVVIEFDDKANQCDMSVQLETLPELLKTRYQPQELVKLYTQYQTFFDKMGGFLSFLMPSPDGLLVHFKQPTLLPDDVLPLMDDNGNVKLTQEWLDNAKQVDFKVIPLRITASINQ